MDKTINFPIFAAFLREIFKIKAFCRSTVSPYYISVRSVLTLFLNTGFLALVQPPEVAAGVIHPLQGFFVLRNAFLRSKSLRRDKTAPCAEFV